MYWASRECHCAICVFANEPGNKPRRIQWVHIPLSPLCLSETMAALERSVSIYDFLGNNASLVFNQLTFYPNYIFGSIFDL